MLQAVGESILNLLNPFSQKVISALKQNMGKNMEIFALLRKLQASMPNVVTVSEVNSIKFEDVLGRTKHLPYDCFRQWEVFGSMLRCEFKGLPGEQKVLKGEYVLINGMQEGLEIDKQTWEQTVFPKTYVKLSVILKIMGASRKTAIYPRCERTGVTYTSLTETLLHCPGCALDYVPASSQELRIMPGLSRETTSIQAKASSAALESYCDRVPERLHHLAPSRSRVDVHRNGTSPTKEMQVEHMKVFRMIHIHDTSIASRSGRSGEFSAATTKAEDTQLRNYLKAVLIDDRVVRSDLDAFMTAYTTTFGKLSSHLELRTPIYDAICEMISSHVGELATDIKKKLRPSGNGIDAEMGQALIDDIWPYFKNRIHKIESVSRTMVRADLISYLVAQPGLTST